MHWKILALALAAALVMGASTIVVPPPAMMAINFSGDGVAGFAAGNCITSTDPSAYTGCTGGATADQDWHALPPNSYGHVHSIACTVGQLTGMADVGDQIELVAQWDKSGETTEESTASLIIATDAGEGQIVSALIGEQATFSGGSLAIQLDTITDTGTAASEVELNCTAYVLP